MSHSIDHGGNIFNVARMLGVSPDAVTDFSASINPLGISPLVRKAMLGTLDSLIHYPDSSHKDLKLALACHHNLSAENFVIANGSTELIYNLPAMLPGKRALIISPSFSEYVRALKQHHWEIKHFILTPENNFVIDTEKLQKTLAGGIDALYLCNPGNPDGSLHSQQVVEHIHSLCVAAGTFMVLDEAFMDFCEEASAKHFVVHSDNAIVLRSMTKFFGIPGLRLGYAIGNPVLTGHLDAMGGPWSVNTLAQAAGTAALQDHQHNRLTLEFICQERRELIKKLRQFSCLNIYHSSANYLLLESTGTLAARELRELLMLQRILIRDCSSFIGLSERFFRISIRTNDENQRLLECLKKVLM